MTHSLTGAAAGLALFLTALVLASVAVYRHPWFAAPLVVAILVVLVVD